MAFSFKDNFNNNNVSIPKGLIEYFNQNLHENLFYRPLDDDTLILSSTKNMNFTFQFELTESQKKILGSEYKFLDAIMLMYNSQEPFKVKNNDGKILINGKYIDIDKIVIGLHKEMKKGSLYLIPPKFDSVKDLELSNDTFTIVIPIKRIPDNSVDKLHFVNTKKYFFDLNLFIDATTYLMSFSVNYDLNKCHSIYDIVSYLSIYNSLLEGTCKLWGKELYFGGETKTSEIYKSKLDFWNKVYSIEKLLKIKFNTPYNVDMKCIYDIEEIYQNIIQRNIIKKMEKIDSITCTPSIDFSIDQFSFMIGKVHSFSFEQIKTFELFGTKITMKGIIYINNAKVTNITEEDDHLILHLNHPNDVEKMIVSSILFENDDELKKFRNKDLKPKDTVGNKTIQDYLDAE